MVFVRPGYFTKAIGPEDEQGSDYHLSNEDEGSHVSSMSDDSAHSDNSGSDGSDAEMLSDFDNEIKSSKEKELHEELQAEKYLSILGGLWPQRIFKPSLIGTKAEHSHGTNFRKFTTPPTVLASEYGRPHYEKSMRELLAWIRYQLKGEVPSEDHIEDLKDTLGLRVPAEFPDGMDVFTYHKHAKNMLKTMRNVLRRALFPVPQNELSNVLARLKAELGDDAEDDSLNEHPLKITPQVAQSHIGDYLVPMKDKTKSSSGQDADLENREKCCHCCLPIETSELGKDETTNCDICSRLYHKKCVPDAEKYRLLTNVYTCPKCRPPPEKGPTCRLPGCYEKPAENKLYCSTNHGELFLKMVFSHVQGANPHKLALEVSKLVDESGVNIPQLETLTLEEKPNTAEPSRVPSAEEIRLLDRITYLEHAKQFLAKAVERRTKLVLAEPPEDVVRPDILDEYTAFYLSKARDWQPKRGMPRRKEPWKRLDIRTVDSSSEDSFEYGDDSEWEETWEQAALRVVLAMHPSDDEYTDKPLNEDYIAEDIFGEFAYFNMQPNDGTNQSQITAHGQESTAVTTQAGLLTGPALKKRRVIQTKTQTKANGKTNGKSTRKKPVTITGDLIRRRIEKKRALKKEKEAMYFSYLADNTNLDYIEEPCLLPEVCGMDSLLIDDPRLEIPGIVAQARPLEDGPTVCHEATVVCAVHADWPELWSRTIDIELRETRLEVQRLGEVA